MNPVEGATEKTEPVSHFRRLEAESEVLTDLALAEGSGRHTFFLCLYL